MDFTTTSIARYMGPAPALASTPRGSVVATDLL
jgi:hypothetical protein